MGISRLAEQAKATRRSFVAEAGFGRRREGVGARARDDIDLVREKLSCMGIESLLKNSALQSLRQSRTVDLYEYIAVNSTSQLLRPSELVRVGLERRACSFEILRRNPHARNAS